MAFDERTYLIMAYHDRDDEQGKEALRKKGLEKAILLYDIFKDADALDRWRISPTALDVRYLRTDWAPGPCGIRKAPSGSNDLAPRKVTKKTLLIL